MANKTIIEEEYKNNQRGIMEKFIEYEENWHNGKTYKFKNKSNEIEDARYSQFKTIINKQNQDYFVYDEVIQINNKPILVSRIHDDKKKEIWELIIYFKDDNVVQQIRHLNYEHFFAEIKSDEDIIKTEESKNTIIIKTPFLEFIENANQEKNEFKSNQKVKKTWWKHLLWKTLGKVMFVFAWAAISPIGNLLIAPLLVGVVSATVLTWLPFVIAGLIVGSVVIGYNKYKSKLKKWFFPNWKSKNEINLENKLQEQQLMLEKKNQLELFLTMTQEMKQERILNCFQQIWKKNKTKDFEALEKELKDKFIENKKELEKQNLKKTYEEKIAQWNESWEEKVEFSKFLKPRHIEEVKETFKASEETQSIMPDGFFYQPKKTWDEFQAEKNIENSKKDDNLKKEDIREKSPVRIMKKNSFTF